MTIRISRGPGPQIGFLQEMLRWWDHWLKGARHRRDGRADAARLDAGQRAAAPSITRRCPAAGSPSRPGRRRASWRARLFLTDGGLAGGARRAGAACRLLAARPSAGTRGEWCPFGRGNGPGRRPARGRRALAAVRHARRWPRRRRDPGRAGGHAGARVRQAGRAAGRAALRRASRRALAARQLRRAEPHPSRQPRRARSPGAGQRYRMRLQLNDCGAGFPAGHRIRLALSTAYWPMVWPAPETATVTISGGTLEPADASHPGRRVVAAAPAAGVGAARQGASGPAGGRALRSHRARGRQRGQLQRGHPGRRSDSAPPPVCSAA